VKVRPHFRPHFFLFQISTATLLFVIHSVFCILKRSPAFDRYHDSTGVILTESSSLSPAHVAATPAAAVTSPSRQPKYRGGSPLGSSADDAPVRTRTLTATTSLPSLPVAAALSPVAATAANSRPTAPPPSTADLHSMLEVFDAPEHISLLKKAFAVYSAINKHRRKEAPHEAGFEALLTSVMHLDLGELHGLLKATHIVPRWISVNQVQTLFHQHVRRHYPLRTPHAEHHTQYHPAVVCCSTPSAI
jgi:hypothetical protein